MEDNNVITRKDLQFMYDKTEKERRQRRDAEMEKYLTEFTHDIIDKNNKGDKSVSKHLYKDGSYVADFVKKLQAKFIDCTITVKPPVMSINDSIVTIDWNETEEQGQGTEEEESI